MELQKIKQLIDLLAASNLGELELVEGDHKVRLVKRVHTVGPASSVAESFVGERSVTTQVASTPAPHANPSGPVSATATDIRAVVTAPLYGVVHLTPAPDAPAFVNHGDTVQPGQTLCVVEAMKMFHEVKADRVARVQAILASAGQEVDVGEPLFWLATTD